MKSKLNLSKKYRSAIICGLEIDFIMCDVDPYYDKDFLLRMYVVDALRKNENR